MENELRKYEVEAMVQDILNEDVPVEVKKVVEDTKKVDINVDRVIRRVIAEAMMGPIGFPVNGEENVDPKYKKTRFLLQALTDLNYKLMDASYQDFPDVAKAFEASSEPMVKFLLQKLMELWCGTAAPVGSEQTPKAPTAASPEVAVKELVLSPQNIQYSVESIVGTKVYLKDIHEGTMHTADLDSVKKWKNNNKK